MLRSNKACAAQLLSLCSRAHEPQLLSPRTTTTEARAPRACAPQQEARTPQRRVAPVLRLRGSEEHTSGTPVTDVSRMPSSA